MSLTDHRGFAPGAGNGRPGTVADGPAVPLTLVVGNPRPGSRTLGVARWVTEFIRTGVGANGVRLAEPDVIDLAELSPLLPTRLTAGSADGMVDRALLRLQVPGILVVASPTFKGSYTGLLKLFLDLLPREALSGSVAVPVMTAAFSAHRFAADTYLRPLLIELGACVPARGLSVTEREFGELDAAGADWAATSLPVLSAVIRSDHRLVGPAAP
jgi:FMN reductase